MILKILYLPKIIIISVKTQKSNIMKQSPILLITMMLVLLTGCGGKTTAECKNDIRAYEFGREMHTWVELRAAGLSLDDAIEEYSNELGISSEYDASNECVSKGFDDASNNIESPYNKEGKSWTKF
jgi:hypothetical protein